MTYRSTITLIDDSTAELPISVGLPLFIVGPNGSGKSGLVFRLFISNPDVSIRISAHRQNYMESNYVPFSPRDKVSNEQNVQQQDRIATARHFEWAPQYRIALLIADLIEAENEIGRKVRDAIVTGSDEVAKEIATSASPIQKINELLAGAGVPISLLVGQNSSIEASKRGSGKFSIAALSDGERAAFYIGGKVLTARPGSLVLIDEPERHLHPSIVMPLLAQLFALRQDCAFVISTHELALPVFHRQSSTVVVRDSFMNVDDVSKWDINILSGGAQIDDDTKAAIIGSRRKILFIEGTSASLDQPLYEILFPGVSIVPRGSCGEVERTVDDVNASSEINWVEAFGIVDQDQISPTRRTELTSKGIYPLEVYSVESLYFQPDILQNIAIRQARVLDADVTSLLSKAWSDFFSAVEQHKARLVARMSEGRVKDRLSLSMPDWRTISSGQPINIFIDVAAELGAETSRLENLIATGNGLEIMRRYPVRETPGLSAIAAALGFQNLNAYFGAVRKLVREDSSIKSSLRGLFAGLDQLIR